MRKRTLSPGRRCAGHPSAAEATTDGLTYPPEVWRSASMTMGKPEPVTSTAASGMTSEMTSALPSRSSRGLSSRHPMPSLA